MRRTRTTWTTTLAASGLALALLSGCGAAADEPAAAGEGSGGSGGSGETHVMPDGSVMSGSEHVHDDSHSHGESDAHEGDGGAAEDTVGPSETASMICGGQVAADVQRLTGLDELPEPASTWQSPMFRCTFELAEGPLILSVHDVEDEAAGMEHFEARRAALAPAKELEGMYGLGLPAFQTPDGSVAFIRDGKTLEVDATALATGMGPDGSLDQSDLAYAVATSVLACWTAHS